MTSAHTLLLGIDVVDVARFRQFVARTPAQQLAELFTTAELASVGARADVAPGLAARFAAKEAVIKALEDLSGYALDWRDIEILGTAGAPRIKLSNEVAEAARRQRVVDLKVSISHSRDTAIAQVVGTRAADGSEVSWLEGERGHE